MRENFGSLFQIYRPAGFKTALWTILRVLILPFSKIDKMIPKNVKFIDIGCGNGGLVNYLTLKSPKRVGLGIDASKSRIFIARATVGNRKNINFILGDATCVVLPKVKYYLLADVLHHISYHNQEKLLKTIVGQLGKNSYLIIKDVDRDNKIPFLFGHFWEKILYPQEKIYVSSKNDWIKLFSQLGLNWTVETGNLYFPDSTLIFKCRKT